MPGAPDTLVEHVRAAGKVGAPGLLKALGTGRAGSAWLSYEYTAGRSLHAVLARAREEGFPLSQDNALEITRQVCISLEKVHARQVGGTTLVHGYVAPWSVMLSFDGAVRLRGFGLWAGRALGGPPTLGRWEAQVVRVAKEKGRAAAVFAMWPAFNMFPQIEGLPKGIPLFSLHAADGTPIALTDTLQAAIGHAHEDELAIAPLN